MAGFDVSRQHLDQKAGETVLKVREAFREVETVYGFLATVPKVPEGQDPLTTPISEGGSFGYTEDEAYLIRLVFEGLHHLPISQLIEPGRRLTGLM